MARHEAISRNEYYVILGGREVASLSLAMTQMEAMTNREKEAQVCDATMLTVITELVAKRVFREIATLTLAMTQIVNRIKND